MCNLMNSAPPARWSTTGGSEPCEGIPPTAAAIHHPPPLLPAGIFKHRPIAGLQNRQPGITLPARVQPI